MLLSKLFAAILALGVTYAAVLPEEFNSYEAVGKQLSESVVSGGCSSEFGSNEGVAKHLSGSVVFGGCSFQGDIRSDEAIAKRDSGDVVSASTQTNALNAAMDFARAALLAVSDCTWTCVKSRCVCLKTNEPFPQDDKSLPEDVAKDIDASLSANSKDVEAVGPDEVCQWVCFGFSCEKICHNKEIGANSKEVEAVEPDKICEWVCFGFSCMKVCHNKEIEPRGD